MSLNAIGGPAWRMSCPESSGMTVFARTTSTSRGWAAMIFCAIALLASSMDLYSVMVDILAILRSRSLSECAVAICPNVFLLSCRRRTRDRTDSPKGVDECLEPGIAAGDRAPVVLHDLRTV